MSDDRHGGPLVWWLAGDDTDALLALLDEQAAGLERRSGPGDGAGGDGAGSDAASAPIVQGSGPARLGIVDPDERKLRLARRMLGEGAPWRGRSDLWFTPSGLAHAGGKIAFLFPGVEPVFGAEHIAVDVLANRLGLDLPPLDEDTIAHRSASIVRLGIFLDQALHLLGVQPDVMAGHSIGEWSGSVASGIFTRRDADTLLDGIDLGEVELPDLDFAALSAGAGDVAPLVAGIEHLVVSHDNCPGQSVVCGPPSVVGPALAKLREAGILGYTLDFQSGFHTPFIAPSLVVFREYLDGMAIHAPVVPMWSATTVGPYPSGGDEIADLHLRHLVEPVRFRPMIERLYHEAGVRIFVQAGIGTLTGFVDDTLGDLDHSSVQVLSPKRPALAQVYRALTALWVEGVPVRPEVLTPGSANAATTPTPAAVPPPAVTAPKPAPPRPAATTPPPVTPPAVTTPAVTTPGPAPDGTGAVAASYPLLAAAEMLTTAALASQGIIDALSARLAAAHGTAVPSAAPALAPAPATVATLAPPAAPPTAPVTAPAGPSGGAHPAPPTAPVPPAPGGTTGAPPPARPAVPAPGTLPWPREKLVVTRRLSLETMPETLDHSLYHQPPGWPDVTDGFPIVAMTTQIQLLQDVAAEYAGGRDVVEVFGVRNLRWLDLSSPQDVDIVITPKGDDVLSIALGGYCRANIRVGSFRPAPRHEARPLANPHPTKVTAEEMFARRIMFHGPRFQGINTLGPTGDDGILAEFHNLDTPGSLLDNLGKIIAYWVIEQRNVGESPLPIGVDRIELFGPLPPAGIDLHCDVRILELQDSIVRADGVLVLPDGSVFCTVEGWTSNVFHVDQVMEPVYHETPHRYATEPQPGGWNVVIERWPTGAGRDLTARRYLSRVERELYAAKNLLEQRRWLIDVVAAKDSVRHWLGERYGIGSWPVQVSLEEDGERRFRAVSPLIPEGHDLRVTVSALNWLAVAIVGDGEHRDIEAVEVPDGTDPEAAAAQAAEAVRARNPGAAVACVPRAENVTPSSIDIVVVPPFAVAWTAG